LNDDGLTRYRRETVGIVFQFFNLMPLLSSTENAALPALLAGKPRRESLERAKSLLEAVGLGHRLNQQASLLSGGEMQRVAVARALVNRSAFGSGRRADGKFRFRVGGSGSGRIGRCR
jgi:predicted ABC-type transport system involved in lysophospholipase L1 biosynthesis ATPase subunit